MGRQNAGFVRLALDLGERIFVILLGMPFIIAFIRAVRVHPSFILVLISETLAIVLILTRRRGEIALRPLAVLAAFAGTALPLMVRPGGAAIAPQLISSILMFGGLSVSILSKLYLNRSFGMIAANRGIKIGGPYRFVRHPMYLGAIFLYPATALIFGSRWALALSGLMSALFVWRTALEDRTLRQELPGYREFAASTRYRLVPGLW